jgi:hypothetical protein
MTLGEAAVCGGRGGRFGRRSAFLFTSKLLQVGDDFFFAAAMMMRGWVGHVHVYVCFNVERKGGFCDWRVVSI